MAKDNMGLLGWLRKQLAEAEPDLLREVVRSFAEALMGAEADALCGAAFRSRPLDAGPYPYLWLDALAVRVREGGRIVRCACVVATAVNADGYPEILGLDLFTSEDETAWRTFLSSLTGRGLSGVQLVVSDDHRGLTKAV